MESDLDHKSKKMLSEEQQIQNFKEQNELIQVKAVKEHSETLQKIREDGLNNEKTNGKI